MYYPLIQSTTRFIYSFKTISQNEQRLAGKKSDGHEEKRSGVRNKSGSSSPFFFESVTQLPSCEVGSVFFQCDENKTSAEVNPFARFK